MIISDKLTGHDIIRPVVAFGSMKGEAKRKGGSVKAVRTRFGPRGGDQKFIKSCKRPFNMAPCPCLRCHSVRTMPKKYYLNPKSALKICASFTCQSKLWRQRNRIDLRRTRTSKSDFVLWGFHFKYVPNFVMVRWACLCSDKLSRTQISRERAGKTMPSCRSQDKFMSLELLSTRNASVPLGQKSEFWEQAQTEGLDLY